MIFLTFVLIILTFTAYYLNQRSLVSPAILFSGGLTIAAAIAWINESAWNLQLDFRTFLVITLGTIEFIIVSYITNFIFDVISRHFSYPKNKNSLSISNYVGKRFKIVLLIQVIIVLISIIIIRRATGISDLMTAINYVNYVQNGFIKGQINLPSYFSVLLIFNTAVGLTAGYVFLEEIIINKRFTYIPFFNLIFGLALLLTKNLHGVLQIQNTSS